MLRYVVHRLRVLQFGLPSKMAALTCPQQEIHHSLSVDIQALILLQVCGEGAQSCLEV